MLLATERKKTCQCFAHIIMFKFSKMSKEIFAEPAMSLEPTIGCMTHARGLPVPTSTAPIFIGCNQFKVLSTTARYTALLRRYVTAVAGTLRLLLLLSNPAGLTGARLQAAGQAGIIQFPAVFREPGQDRPGPEAAVLATIDSSIG